MSAPFIQAIDLWKTYEMGSENIHALHGVTFEVRKNEYLAIMGPSGSGKSTLMNLIGCLDTPSRGQYLFNGELVSNMRDDTLADIRNQEIGFVFQSFNLLPKTSARQNVELPLIYAGKGATERRKASKKVLEMVGLGDRIDHFPNELSGGQSQRVAIARALVTLPSLLLADEPTGNLDSKTGLEIMSLFDKLHRDGRTVILVTHELAVAEHADRIIFLKDGKIDSETVTV